MQKQFKELFNYRSLLYIFVYRDYKAKYKHTVLGIAWSIIQPLFLMLIFTLVFSHFFKVNTGGKPYPVFSFVALLPWTFISSVVNSAGNKFVGSRPIISRIYFPREIIPLSTVVSSLLDSFFATFVFILMLLFYKIPITPLFLFILIILPVQILLASGLSLIMSVMSVLFRDLHFAMPLLIQIWMYASPVIYSVHNLQDKFKPLFYFNPLTGIIDGYRNIILDGKPPDFSYLASSAIFSVLVFIVGYRVFKKLEYTLVDIM